LEQLSIDATCMGRQMIDAGVIFDGGLLMGTYISQHVVQARWLGSFPLGSIGACVFCLFFAKM
jgi:hypothetical protein